MDILQTKQDPSKKTSPAVNPYYSTELNLGPVRPQMCLVDRFYEPIKEADSDVQDSDDQHGSVDADDVTQPTDTDVLREGSTTTTSVIPNESTSAPSEPSSEESDPYDSEEETEPLNFSDRLDPDSESSFTDESDFDSSNMSPDSNTEGTTVGITTDYDIEEIPTMTYGQTLEDEEREINEVWDKAHQDELGIKAEAVHGGGVSMKVEPSRHPGRRWTTEKHDGVRKTRLDPRVDFVPEDFVRVEEPWIKFGTGDNLGYKRAIRFRGGSEKVF